jgi:hypothetical protein
MAQSTTVAHDRIVEIVFTAANGAQTVTVSGLNYYRNRAKLIDAAGFKITFSPTTAQAVANPPEIFLGEILPPPTVIRLTATVTA